jgi:hypothetical protein
MGLSADTERQLREIQDQALANAVEEMQAAAELGLEEKQARGDRFWLTKMATQSLTLAGKIEGFIMLRSRETPPLPGEEEEQSEKRATDRLIKEARGEVAAIIERARAGYRPRGKSDE